MNTYINYYSNKITRKKNKNNILGLICNTNINKNELIMSCDLNNIIYANSEKELVYKLLNNKKFLISIKNFLNFHDCKFLNCDENEFIYHRVNEERKKFALFNDDRLIVKKLYVFVKAYSHGFNTGRCISPACLINHTPYYKSPKLIHKIIDNQWKIYTDKDYLVDEEILDCYTSNYLVSNNNTIINDWKTTMSVFYGDMYNL